jgi:hypothetical protein
MARLPFGRAPLPMRRPRCKWRTMAGIPTTVLVIKIGTTAIVRSRRYSPASNLQACTGSFSRCRPLQSRTSQYRPRSI